MNYEVIRLKKIISVATVAVIAVSCSVISVSAENEKEDDIVILYTNDVHCGITDNIGYDGLALYKREMEASHEHVLLADAGDAIQGGIIGTLTDGSYITKIMNEVHYDVAALGNHEFDYSIPTLLKRADELGGIVPEEYKNPEGQGRIKITDGQETPEKSEPESSKPVQEDSKKTDTESSVIKDPVPDTDSPKTGDSSSAAA